MLRQVLHPLLTVLLLAAALAGCATVGSERVTTDAGAAMSARPPLVGADPAAAAATQAQHYRVQPGESLSQIADRLGVGLTALADANGIAKPYNVHAGQFLVVPPRAPAPRTTAAVADNSTVET